MYLYDTGMHFHSVRISHFVIESTEAPYFFEAFRILSLMSVDGWLINMYSQNGI